MPRKPTIDPHQIESLHQRMRQAISEQPVLNRIYGALLEIGGQAVAPQYEEDAEKILTRGRVMKPKGLRMMKGIRSACHANTARLYEANPEKVQIVTGYALSADGIWRQHTWGMANGKVVETTEPREAYFGFVLTSEEAERFCYFNI